MWHDYYHREYNHKLRKEKFYIKNNGNRVRIINPKFIDIMKNRDENCGDLVIKLAEIVGEIGHISISNVKLDADNIHKVLANVLDYAGGIFMFDDPHNCFIEAVLDLNLDLCLLFMSSEKINIILVIK